MPNMKLGANMQSIRQYTAEVLPRAALVMLLAPNFCQGQASSIDLSGDEKSQAAAVSAAESNSDHSANPVGNSQGFQFNSQRNLYFIDRPVRHNIATEVPTSAAQSEPRSEDLATDFEYSTAIQAYRQTILELKSSGNAWNNELIQQLQALASIANAQSDYPTAVAYLNEALQINRINSGLHNPNQISILRALLESHLALGDWRQADEYYDYLLFLEVNKLGVTDVALIPILREIAFWQLQLFHAQFTEDRAVRLRRAQLLLFRAVELVDEKIQRLAEAPEQTQQLVTAHFTKLSLFREIANTAFVSRNHADIYDNYTKQRIDAFEDRFRRQYQLKRRNRNRGYSVVTEFLEAALELTQYGVLPAEEEVRSLLDLADWYLLSRDTPVADSYYSQAWQRAQSLSLSECVQEKLFAAPMPIPSFSNDDAYDLAVNFGGEQHPRLQENVFQVKVRIGRGGIAQRVEAVDEAIASSATYRFFRRRIVRSLFRPVITENGRINSSENLYSYRFWH